MTGVSTRKVDDLVQFTGDEWDLEVSGLAVRGAQRASERLSRAQARGSVAVPVTGCDVSQGQGRRAGGEQGGGHRGGDERRRAPRGAGARGRAGRDRGIWAGVPARPHPTWVSRRSPGHLRRARRVEAGGGEGAELELAALPRAFHEKRLGPRAAAPESDGRRG